MKMCGSRVVRVGLSVLVLGAVIPAPRIRAQASAALVSGPGPLGRLTPAPVGMMVRKDTAQALPCPDCNPPKRFWAAAGELMAAQVIPWFFSYAITQEEFAQIGPSTWATNIQNPWVWDNNTFANNQFAHPFHGSLYYNAARSNGYSFWESVPWPFAGSLMWEWFGEAWAPAPNDFTNTSLGGITLGEMLWRVSSLTLDNTATGAERTFREIGATLLNPVRGFNRIIRGEVNDVTANPPEWRPGKLFASVDVGYKGLVAEENTGMSGELNATYADVLLAYGDQVEDLSGAPFSAFTVRAELSTNQGDQSALSSLVARGNLGALTLSSAGNTTHQLAGMIFYEMQKSPATEFGGQGFAGGVISRWGDPQGFRIQSKVLATVWPVMAVQSDYYVTLEGRDYDYGLGFGGEASVAAIDEGRWGVQASGRYIWEPVLSGFDGDHYQAGGTLDGRFYLWGRVGLGASGSVYWRHSVYEDFADVETNATQVRAYATLAVPRWTP